MAQPVSLAQLRDRAKKLADMEESDFVSDAEWRELLNVGIAELWDLLVQAAPPEFEAAEVTLPFAIGDRLLPLPANFRTLVAVLEVDGERQRPLFPMRAEERARVTSPQRGGVLVVEYTPTAPQLVSDVDTVNFHGGWERLVTAMAARDALLKEESDTSVMQNIVDRETMRIRTAGGNRDRGQPKVIGEGEDLDANDHIPWSAGAYSGRLRYRLRGGNLELYSL